MSEISRAGVALSQQEIDRLIKKGDRNPQKSLLGVHALLLLGGIFMVFPFVYQVLMSLSTNAEIQAVPPKFVPDKWQVGNYAEVFTRLPFLKQFGVSVTITVLRTVAQLALCAMGGYAFARMKFGGQVDLLRSRVGHPDGAGTVVPHWAVPDHSWPWLAGDAVGHCAAWFLFCLWCFSHATVVHEYSCRT